MAGSGLKLDKFGRRAIHSIKISMQGDSSATSRHPLKTIDDLLDIAKVKEKYSGVFSREKLTLENFVKLV